ncbi:hypothetical protein SCB71_12215 [Herbiconiux sp. KACC 21604]|uniref:hypothetical protein n=1 Tax=unclassified Herbiconiux TaxID=2618217 RepID=UPI001492EE46|nr:hypothetical protein [Herbiconiux sp. SALV-R1]QJU53953.1 hypothetical protein HL652_10165 [Herbiconiux sp. SALV-R1]WPO84981.1 hypothetical protein SCB71_12215 [Herbiconiux sp. KACC 21604]
MITVVKNGRLNPDVRLWTGIAAISVGLLTFAEFLVQALLVGARPALDDDRALTEFMTRTANQTLFTILIDTFLMAALIVFISGFRQLITHTRPDLQWVANIMYGAGLLFIAVTLVGDAMEGGTALDTMGLDPDASSLRALTVGHTLMFGSIGCTLNALVAASAAYLTIASEALPKWTGYIAYAVAGLNLLSVPTMFGGTAPDSFFAAGGAATAMLATFPWLVWVVCVGFVAIRDRRRLEHLSPELREQVGAEEEADAGAGAR